MKRTPQSALTDLRLPRFWINPEFQRLLWRYFHWALAALPVLVTLLVYDEGSFGIQAKAYYVLILLFIGALLVLGLIQSSVKSDLNGFMFDQLRMSSLSVGQMTYARLIAAPLLGWQVFLLGLGLLAFHPVIRNYQQAWVPISVWAPSLFLWLWALACLTLMSSLQARHGHYRWHGGRVQSILFIIAGIMLLVDGQHWLAQHKDLHKLFQNLWVRFLEILPYGLFNLKIALGMALWMSWLVYLSMASALHLARVQGQRLLAMVLLPCIFMPLWVDKEIFFMVLAIIYGGLAWISLITEENRPALWLFYFRQKRFGELPLWIGLLPLTCLCAMMVFPTWLGWYLPIFGKMILFFIGLSLIKLPYNRSSLALLLYMVMQYF
ncbi:MAG: hypothetical protein Q4B71_06870 [Cardiobacteriaceae bacterium]|nr:hypothetical protein [Cardiobacteriaceae bacterium]